MIPNEEVKKALNARASLIREGVVDLLDNDPELRGYIANVIANAVTDINYLKATGADEVFVASVCTKSMYLIANKIMNILEG